jgi:uncharacterized protein (DUF302 family)
MPKRTFGLYQTSGCLMIRSIAVEHYEHVSDRSFESVVAALKAATGSVEEGFAQVTNQATNSEEFEAIFRAREGSSGFMRFDTFDHGKWLQLIGQTAKAVMVILGNPLIARTMLQHDIRAGLNVPVRLLIYEHTDGSTRVAYDLPSSLMSGLENADVTAAATKLDEKLVALAKAITGVGAENS